MQIQSIVSIVPKSIEVNKNLPFDHTELQKIIDSSGIEEKRIANKETSAAQLCKTAAKHLFEINEVNRNDIGVLIFVTQYPDFILPSTVHTLQHQLGLAEDTIAIQINEGCAGYIYGIYLAQSLLATSSKSKALLLVGDTTSKVIDKNDQATRPLFGDAGSATLIAKSQEGMIQIKLGGDGVGEDDIKVNDGSFKNGFRNPPLLKMDGMNVFMFGISRVPKYIESFITEFNIDKSKIDYIVLHQANKMMNERIIRKLNFSEEKALYSLQKFGNTSNASIPLTLCLNLVDKISDKVSILACGFGVGLAWGTMEFELDENVNLALIEYEK
jgi:3-oxoacyl-[acyl-carrier-protein] synthase III